MGIASFFGFSRAREFPTPETIAGPMLESLAHHLDDFNVEQLWAEQPHLRTVTDFIARSIASVNLHTYKRMDDGGRERVREGMVPRLMRKAGSELTIDLLHGSILDLCLYDEFFWLVKPDRNGGDYSIQRIPPTWIISRESSDPWTLKSVTVDDSPNPPMKIPADQLVWVRGYRPGSFARGLSPVNALKDTLKEQLESSAYRAQLWRNGPRLGGVITRPANAKWDATARRRFKAAWQSQYSGRGSGAGGTPILEDGMDFKSLHLKANDEQVVDVTKLSLQTVASVYHINPTQVGLLDNANYSNVREFRRSLYGDSLGPIIKKIELAINEVLIPMIGAPAGEYVEFNLDEKLRASFEEKAQVTSTAVGGPWMTVNEARAMNNLTAVDGGDKLIRPLNVGIISEDGSTQEPGDDAGAVAT